MSFRKWVFCFGFVFLVCPWVFAKSSGCGSIFSGHLEYFWKSHDKAAPVRRMARLIRKQVRIRPWDEIRVPLEYVKAPLKNVAIFIAMIRAQNLPALREVWEKNAGGKEWIEAAESYLTVMETKVNELVTKNGAEEIPVALVNQMASYVFELVELANRFSRPSDLGNFKVFTLDNLRYAEGLFRDAVDKRVLPKPEQISLDYWDFVHWGETASLPPQTSHGRVFFRLPVGVAYRPMVQLRDFILHDVLPVEIPRSGRNFDGGGADRPVEPWNAWAVFDHDFSFHWGVIQRLSGPTRPSLIEEQRFFDWLSSENFFAQDTLGMLLAVQLLHFFKHEAGYALTRESLEGFLGQGGSFFKRPREEFEIFWRRITGEKDLEAEFRGFNLSRQDVLQRLKNFAEKIYL